ncbi:MAG: endolytic transglycosylase MltG [Actinomycetota bacterium]|nr:endolytic transglycosylase MltG [Actinomycetota bacterium]
MGEPPVLTPPSGRGPRRRSNPRRRVVGGVALLVLVLAVLAAVAWLGARIARSGGDDEAPATTRAATTHAAPRRKPPRPLRIVFPEGFTRRQMAERIAAVNAIARSRRRVRPRLSPRRYIELTSRSRFARTFPGAQKALSLEGFLFPALYEFTPTTTTRELIDRQLEAFRRNWSTVSLRYARSRNLTPYDVLIIASMIEEEVAAASERRLVAAVIYNRLKARMPLGIDATIRYALRVPPTESLRRSQLRHPTPYNTRIHLGLPPTPITNPGLASMEAAAHPARRNFLYFVRKPDKVHHFFTASEREFLAYQRAHGYG